MNKIIFISLLLGGLVFNSCTKSLTAKKSLRIHALAACGEGINSINSAPHVWGNKVLSSLTNDGFDIQSSNLGFIKPKEIEGPHCGNCLETGDFLDVKVPEDQEEDLEILGFVKI